MKTKKAYLKLIVIGVLGVLLFQSCSSGGEDEDPITQVPDSDDPVPTPDDPADIEVQLRALVDGFRETLANKNGAAHATLFLSPSSQLNLPQKNYGDPVFLNLSLATWISAFTGWDFDYYTEYTNDVFTIKNGVAIETVDFEGFQDNVRVRYGMDQFMHINTSEGWKILNISSTIVNADDETDYSLLPAIINTPNDIFDTLSLGLNERNTDTFGDAFLTAGAACLSINNQFDGEYDSSLHSANAYYQSFETLGSNVQIGFANLSFEINDQLTAVATGDYSITQGDSVLEQGELLGNMVATPTIGWKISSLVFTQN